MLPPQYNILEIAGSTLGFKHIEKTLVKMKKAKTGEDHPMFGKIGKNHPFYGKIQPTETKAKISLALFGPQRGPDR